MKKYNSVLMIIIIISIVFVSFLIQKNDTAYDDLGIYDTKSQQTIKIGDSKEQIEKYIGSSKSNDAFKCTYGGMCNPSLYKSGAKELTVVYNRQEKAKEFILKPCWNKKHSRFCLSSGIDIYCGVKEFHKYYSKYTEKKIDGMYCSTVQCGNVHIIAKYYDYTQINELQIK